MSDMSHRQNVGVTLASYMILCGICRVRDRGGRKSRKKKAIIVFGLYNVGIIHKRPFH